MFYETFSPMQNQFETKNAMESFANRFIKLNSRWNIMHTA